MAAPQTSTKKDDTVEAYQLKPGLETYCGSKMDFGRIRLEALCGITVALAQVPEAVAFSFVAGVPPTVGLTAAWIMGVVTALAGGRPAMISGATGAIAAVTSTLVAEYGVEYLLMAVILMGLIQVVAGVFRAGKLVTLIPHPVMMGFCNGLALVIGFAQFTSFKRAPDGDSDDHRRLSGAFGVFQTGGWIDGVEAWWAAAICLLGFLTCVLFPRCTKKLPSSLVAIVLCTGFEWGVVRQLGYKTQLVQDFASVKGSFPKLVWYDDQFEMPPLTLETLEIIAPLAIIMALIGLIESLMTLNLIDEITQTRGNGNRECVAQGLANIICGVLGGMGGCAMIGQSMINVKSGANARMSSACAGFFLLIILLVAYPAINAIPVASLAGVMFNVCVHTFEWSSLKILFFSAMPMSSRQRFGDRSEYKIKRADALAIVIVTGVTLAFDLAIAVVAGVMFMALVFSWDEGGRIRATSRVEVDAETGESQTVYDVSGNLFFASCKTFLDQFDVASDPKKITLRFDRASIVDYSGLEALNTLAARYENAGKQISVQCLNQASKKMLRKATNTVEVAIDYELEAQPFIPPPTGLNVANPDTLFDGTVTKKEEAEKEEDDDGCFPPANSS